MFLIYLLLLFLDFQINSHLYDFQLKDNEGEHYLYDNEKARYINTNVKKIFDIKWPI